MMRVRLSNGLALGYEVRGEGRPFIFLHPIGTRRELWDGVIDRLQERACCIAVDFRGHGESDVPAAPYTLGDLARDVVELMRIRETSGAVIVGCSMGGMVAQAVAGLEPEHVSGLILAGTSHRQTPQSAEVMLRRAQESAHGMPSVVDATIERWLPRKFRSDRAATVKLVRQWLLSNDPVVFSWGWRAIAQLENTEFLRNVRASTLLVRGALDASTPMERMRAMQEMLHRARYIEMPETGHLAPIEQPEELARIIRLFVDDAIEQPD